jgi:hypothetical protein
MDKMCGKMRIWSLLICIVLGTLLVAPVAAEDNSSDGILEAIIDFFTWWIPRVSRPDR